MTQYYYYYFQIIHIPSLSIISLHAFEKGLKLIENLHKTLGYIYTYLCERCMLRDNLKLNCTMYIMKKQKNISIIRR